MLLYLDIPHARLCLCGPRLVLLRGSTRPKPRRRSITKGSGGCNRGIARVRLSRFLRVCCLPRLLLRQAVAGILGFICLEAIAARGADLATVATVATVAGKSAESHLVVFKRPTAFFQPGPHLFQALLAEAGNVQQVLGTPPDERGDRIDTRPRQHRVDVGG